MLQANAVCLCSKPKVKVVIKVDRTRQLDKHFDLTCDSIGWTVWCTTGLLGHPANDIIEHIQGHIDMGRFRFLTAGGWVTVDG